MRNRILGQHQLFVTQNIIDIHALLRQHVDKFNVARGFREIFIHLRTADPEATVAWFERMLGAEIIRTPQAGGKTRIDMKLGGANIFIAPVAPGVTVNDAPMVPYQGLDHFGLSVTGIDAIAADLKSKGVTFTKEPTTVRPGTRVCFIEGPQGVSIELLDRSV